MNPFRNSALQNICAVLLSSISFSKIHQNGTLPILPYKHDAFDLNITIAFFTQHEAAAQTCCGKATLQQQQSSCSMSWIKAVF